MSTKSFKRNAEQKAFVDGAVKAAQEAYARMDGYDAERKLELSSRAKKACRRALAS